MEPDTVSIGYVHPGTVTEPFARSLAQLCLWQPNKIVGLIAASNPRQEVARNEAIRNFLKSPSEWFMWIDTDMSFDHDAVERLRATALKHDADMVAGLAFIYNRGAHTIFPNMFEYTGPEEGFKPVDDYESGRVYEIDGTGSAFMLIHRRVYERWDNEYWHQTWREHPETGQPMGHDLAFCYEVTQTYGRKLLYDTSVKTGHIKAMALTEENYRASQT